MDWGPVGGGWAPFLCGFLVATLLSLVPVGVLALLWMRAEARDAFSRLEDLLEQDEADD